jgi:hypothetical protein
MTLRHSWLAVVAAGALAFGLVGCGTETTDEPDAQADPAAAAQETTTEAEPNAPPEDSSSGSAALGDSITLGTLDDGEIQVTPVEVKDPATSGNQFIEPDAGNRYVGVRVRINNTGDSVYEDSPSNGASVVDTKDVEWDADVFDAVEPALGTVKITPGDARVGWIAFEVDKQSKLRTFQFSTDSGFGDTGQWTLN